jgi:hypothetical protein
MPEKQSPAVLVLSWHDAMSTRIRHH